MEKKRVFVVVIGMDQKGIIARVSTLFFEQGASIKGVQQKIVGGTFVMTMLADVSDCKVGLAGLHRDLEKTAKAVGLNVMIHKRVGFKSHAQGCRLMTDHRPGRGLRSRGDDPFDDFDIRVVTLGLNLKDLAHPGHLRLAEAARMRVADWGSRLVRQAAKVSQSLGIPIVNKRLPITPAAWLLEPCSEPRAVLVLAHGPGRRRSPGRGGLHRRLRSPGAKRDHRRRPAPHGIPAHRPPLRLAYIRLSVNPASTVAGLNMDAIARLRHILKEMAAAAPQGIACARFVAFEGNPFMVGAFHCAGEPDVALNVGISGPGVVRAVVEKHPDCDFTMLSEAIRRIVFRSPAPAR